MLESWDLSQNSRVVSLLSINVSFMTLNLDEQLVKKIVLKM